MIVRVFPKERTYKDVGLYLRIKTLEWLTYEHLEISRANQVDEMWNLAAEGTNIEYIYSKSYYRWIILGRL